MDNLVLIVVVILLAIVVFKVSRKSNSQKTDTTSEPKQQPQKENIMENNKTDWQPITDKSSKKIVGLEVGEESISFDKVEDRKKVYTYILYRLYESNPSKFKQLSENNEPLKFCCEHFVKVQGVTYTDFEIMYNDRPTFCNLYIARRESGVKLSRWQPKFICGLCNELGPEFGIHIQCVFMQN